MSTILKALKKVEGQRAASIAKSDMPDTPVSPKGRTIAGFKWMIAVGVVLAVAVAVMAGLSYWQSKERAAIAQKAPDKIKVSDNPPAPPPTVAPPLPLEIVPDNKMIETAPSPHRLPSIPPGIQKDTRKTVERGLLAKKQASQQLIAGPEPRTRTQPASGQKAKSIVQPKPSRKIKSDAETSPKEPQIPLLEDRNLEIQALVYSEDATKRMIVLNGEILREGHEYKGFVIETIESQRVLVEKNGKVSALLFGD